MTDLRAIPGSEIPLEVRSDLPPAEPADESASEESSGWRPTSIAEAATDPPPKPDKLSGTIYSDAETLVSGEPGVGKSMFLAAAVAAEAIGGGIALYLDFEGTPGTLAERLEAAGLSDEHLRRIFYLRPTVQASPDEIRAMVADLRPTLIAVDSYDAALAAFGLESKNEDIRAFASAVMAPLRSTGAAVIVADHVAKNREQRGPSSIGGQAKLALADAHLGLSVIAALQRGGPGKLKMKTHKDRHGWLPRTAVFEFPSLDRRPLLEHHRRAGLRRRERVPSYSPNGASEQLPRTAGRACLATAGRA